MDRCNVPFLVSTNLYLSAFQRIYLPPLEGFLLRLRNLLHNMSVLLSFQMKKYQVFLELFASAIFDSSVQCKTLSNLRRVLNIDLLNPAESSLAARHHG